MGALQFGLTLPNGDDLPEEIADPLTLPLLVAEGEPVLLNLGLHDPESETLLWWNPSESSVALTAVAGPVGVLTAGLSDDAPPEQADAFAVTLAPGSVSSLSMSLPEAEFELGELRAAPESDIESLELVVGMYSHFDVVQPMAAIAVARDAEGNRIHGAPIRWSVRGRALAIDHRGDQLGYGDLAGRDYTWVRDDCQRPSAGIGTKSSTLVAEVNGIEAVQKLTWVRTEPSDPEAADADWTRPDVCTGQGCGGCSTTASAQPGRSFSAVALLALLVGVRRRRRG
jgi:MYXO-CTERM domain-containing protein